MEDRFFKSFNIAGFTYYNGADVFEHLKIGVKLRAVAEPENKFDPAAVALYFQDTKLGFIPRHQNREISKFMNLGYSELFEFAINRVVADADPEHQVFVVARINKPE